MTDASKVKVGDEVRVFDVNGRRMGQPEGGWVGRVEKVGRSLVYIQYAANYGKPRPFRKETGVANDAWGHQSFKTLEEVALRDRWRAATSVLSERGLEIKHISDVTLEELEAIADLLRRGES